MTKGPYSFIIRAKGHELAGADVQQRFVTAGAWQTSAPFLGGVTSLVVSLTVQAKV
jgi:hypothetical protein